MISGSRAFILATSLTLVLGGAVYTKPLAAQFQAPSQEELTMKSDAKAPGVDAIYLYREETTDEVNHFHSTFVRIKVLTEKGKELATVRTPYERSNFKVSDIQGRTIHADGTVIPLTAKPEDLMDVKTQKYQVNTMVFTLPSVDVGSILEYRLKIRYSDEIASAPEWEVQQPYFVRKAHYYFKPDHATYKQITDSNGEILDRLMYSARIGPVAKVVADNRGGYSLDLTDIPALPDEDWMPPLNTLKWRVQFYYTYFSSATAFWDKSGKHWAKNVDRFTNPTAAIRKAAADMVAPGDTEAAKAAKIYAAVMKLNNTSFTREKSNAERKAENLKQIKVAEDVWNQKSGSSDDLALLYVSLARADSLKAWPMQVVNRSRAFFDLQYFSLDQLDDYIAVVQIDGKNVYLDPGEKMCAYGALHWSHTLAGGFLLSEKGAAPALTPAGQYNTQVVRRVADLTVDSQGNVQRTVHVVMSGPDALYWRQLALQNDEDEVNKQFNESLRSNIPEGAQAEIDHFLGLEDYNANLVAMVKVSGNLGSATGKRFFLPGLFFQSRAKHPFVELDKRTSPIDVHFAKTEQDDVTYHLPPGFSVESAPQNAKAEWPGNALLEIVGSILEYRLKLNPMYGLSEPVWEVQQSHFVHKARYSFRPNNYYNLMWSARIESGAKVVRDSKNVFTLDIADVPAAPDEDWMPPLNTIKWRVVFYYSNYTSSVAFWKVATKNWAMFVEDFTKPTGLLKKTVADLVAPTDTEEQKARKLYGAVMKLNNTDFSRTKSKAERKKEKIKDIKKAEDVWKQQSGDDDEIALLYVALARAAGLKVWPMQVVSRNRALFDNSYLTSGQMDDFIAVVSIDGKDTFLDPGEKMCPFGALHWKHTLASGFRLSGDDAVLASTPAGNYKSATVQRIAVLKIDDQGNVSGTVRIAMTGPDALHWRQLALENDEDEVKKQFNESIKGNIPEGVQAEFEHFLALEDYDVTLIAVVKVSGSVGTTTGKRFFLPGLFFESNAKHPFVALNKRISPIDVEYPKTEQDDVTYRLPTGYGVESAPEPASSAWPQSAMLKIASSTKGDSVEVVRTLVYNFTLLSANDYPDLRDFYQKVASADQQQLVLIRDPVAKGN